LPRPADACLATVYHHGIPTADGEITASGEAFRRTALTAAHRSLPFGTMVRISNAVTGRSVDVRVNDRGAYNGGFELTIAAYTRVASLFQGEAEVTWTVI
jgi:rare lipoprotein A